jgi:hypothetical protein
MKWTDKKRLDALQKMALQDGRMICRWSSTGRGWRLHETTSHEGAVKDIRQAIDNFLNANWRWKK